MGRARSIPRETFAAPQLAPQRLTTYPVGKEESLMSHSIAALTALLAFAAAVSLPGASPDASPAGVSLLAGSPGGSPGVAPGATALKCPPEEPVLFPDAPDFVRVLDGEAVPDGVEIEMEEIERIEIICAIDLHRVYGVESRRGGAVLFTAPIPRSVLQASLDSISELQQRHLDEHGVYARTLSDLAWDDPSGLITVDLEVSDDGLRWNATGSHLWYFGEGTDITVSGEAPPAS